MYYNSIIDNWEGGVGMTIKRRLFWSNILMIAVPIMATAVVGILCIGFQ